ncbi:glycogen synthase [bacterium]|nr:glycogen synthase [bacterium]
MKILYLSAEATPYVKIGGLGDVAGALPAALRSRGHDVRLMMPAYGLLDRQKFGLEKKIDSFNVQMDWRNETCQMWVNPSTGDSFITNYYFFDNRFHVYGNGDEVEQFVLFCRAALEACRLEKWEPDIIHANDWHTAAAIRLAWAKGKDRPGLVYTIHNMAHQGSQYPSGWPLLGVYDGRGSMNLMQQAIISADVVSTVSPTYAREILTPEGGCGLDGDLRTKGDRVRGVLNGLDLVSYDPSTDKSLAANYSRGNLDNKKLCKSELQRRVGLEQNPDAPLIGMVSRLDFQKGIDLLLQVVDRIIDYSDAQIMVLGSGDHAYEVSVDQAAARHRGRMATYIGYEGDLARQIYAGADIFLMPSLFEPCGLSQLIAMRYGTLPVARATGGLRDTIVDVRSAEDGCGYLFENYDKEEMMYTLFEGAFKDYRDKGRWYAAIDRAMSRDFSWKTAAAGYEELYKLALER